ncbi:MAG: hypothetical protein R2697_03690 [Ilumatobacteraceae bacterium]
MAVRQLHGEARFGLGEAFVQDMIDRDFGDDGKRLKTMTKYGRTPAVLVVGCAPHDNASLHDENRDAVAAASRTCCSARPRPGSPRSGRRRRSSTVRTRSPSAASSPTTASSA